MLFKDELNAENYFHGTNKEYLDMQMKQYGRYQHDTYYPEDKNPVLLRISQNQADKYAHDRSKILYTNKTPIRLVIEGSKVRKRIYENSLTTCPAIDFLLEEDFSIIAI